MVAIVSGNGLGLINTSLTQLGTLFGGQSGIGQSGASQMVNIATGNLIIQDTDDSLDVRGFNTTFLRTYNSQAQLSDVGQDGFVTGYERYVTLNGTLNAVGSTVTLATGDGQKVVFTYSGTVNKYVASVGGALDTMTWTGATTKTWKYLDASTQRQEVYADATDPVLKGRLLSIRDLASDLATPMEFDVIYDNYNRVSQVIAADGAAADSQDAIVFSYNNTTTQLTGVSTLSNGLLESQVNYVYDNFGRLKYVQTDLTPTNTQDNNWSATASANDGKLYRTTYTYTSTTNGSNLQIASVTTSDGVTVSYAYNTNGTINTVTQGSAADGSLQTLTFGYFAGYTTVTDGANHVWTYQFDSNDRLTAVLEPTNNGMRQQTNYTYNANGEVTRISQLPNAGQAALLDTIYQYDANGNRVLARDMSGNTTTWTYNASNQVVSETQYTAADPNGLDPTVTGIDGASGALTTNYVYDTENRLRFVVDATGDVTEYTYATTGNGTGQMASARHYTGATYAGTMTENGLNTWASNTTVMRRSASTLTTYSYDIKGRLQQAIAYADVTADVNGDGKLDAAAAITNYTYSAQGQLLEQISVHGSTRSATSTPAGSTVTDYVYDGMGRLLSVLTRDSGTTNPTDTNSLSTTYAYIDSGHQIQVRFDSGMVQTQLRNAAGQVVSVSQVGTGMLNGALSPVTRITQMYYDNTGLLRASQDAAGAITYYFYDSDGRLVDTVDGTGAVTQTVYSGIGQVVQTIAYANTINTSGWLSAGTPPTVQPFVNISTLVPPVTSGNDRHTYRTYDLSGRLWTKTDATGLVATYAYDSASRLTSVTVAMPGDTTDAPRTTAYYYDNAGREVGVVDADGYLTESVYDDAGRLVQTIRYASPATASSSGWPAQRPTASPNDANDVVARYFYDGRSQLVGELNYVGGTTTTTNNTNVNSWTGYLTTYSYDEQANQNTVLAYGTLLTGLTGNETLASMQSAVSTPAALAAGGVRTTLSTYNALGQLASEVNPEGTTTQYNYDEAGRLVQTVTTDAGLVNQVREQDLRYDAFGDVIGQIGGEQAVAAVASAILGGKQLNDTTLTSQQFDQAYGTYGTTYTYDADGRRIQGTDALGNNTWYYYDADGRQTYTVRGIADSSGNANATGEVTQTIYSAFGQAIDRISYTNRLTLGMAPTWSSVLTLAAGETVGTTDTKVQMGYDQRGLLIQTIDGENALSKYTYTVYGQLQQEQRDIGSTAAVTISHAYDQDGQELSRTDALNVAALQRTVSHTYDAFGRVVTSTDAMGTVTTYGYDRLGRQVTDSVIVEGRLQTASATYDAYARTLTQIDALGNTTTYVYNDANRSVIMTTAQGIVVTTVHNSFGQTIQVTTTAGTTVYAYDRNGELSSTTDADKAISSSTYDVRGMLHQSKDATGNITTYTYDAAGRVLTCTQDPGNGHLNLTTTYTYDGQGRRVTMTDASGRVTQTGYDRDGRVVTMVVDPGDTTHLNLTTQYTWDEAGRELTVTQGYGTAAANTVQYLYDALGRRTKQIVDPGTGHLNLATNYAYDANDNLIWSSDPDGNVTRFYYDNGNQLIYTIDPMGDMTRNWYDEDGRVVATRTFSQPTNPAALTNATTYSDIDKGLVWNVNDKSTYRVYDKDGRVRFVLDGAGDLQETVYDAAGRAVSTRAYATGFSPGTALQSKLFAGTAQPGDIVDTKNDALDQQTYLILDADGRACYSVDALGDVTEMRYDAAGRLVQQLAYVTHLSATDLAAVKAGTALSTGATFVADLAAQAGAAHITYRIYDAAGRERFAIDAQGDISETRYDAAGRVVEQLGYSSPLSPTDLSSLQSGTLTLAALTTDLAAQESSAIASSRVYDAAGRLRFTIDECGDVNETRYDAAGHVVQQLGYVTPIALSATDLASLKAGTLTDLSVAGYITTTMVAAAHTSYQVFDSAGRSRFAVTSSVVNGVAAGTVTETRYDAAGNVVAQIRYGTPVAFDPTQTMSSTVLTGLVSGGNSANDRATYFVYDVANRLRFTVSDLGVLGSTTGDSYTVSERRYDGIGRIAMTRSYSGTVQPSAFTESALAQAVSGITDTRQITYLYDGAGRLASTTDALSQTESYGYDAFGNRTSYTNKLQNTWTYRYDAAGRQIEIDAPAVNVMRLDNNGNPSLDSHGYPIFVSETIVTQFGYDALGNMTSRTDAAENSTDARITNYYYDNRGNLIRTVLPDEWSIQAGVLTANNSRSEIDTTYDALNRVVVQKDADNNYSYKIYNPRGLLGYEIDGNGYVTAYGRDAQGEITGITRYATALNFTQLKTTGWTAGQPISFAQMKATGSAAILVGSAQDRTLTTTYDVAGNKQVVTQPPVNYVQANGQISTTAASPTVQYTYDAYGDVVKQAVQIDDVNWAYTYNYFDDLGRKTMDVDADGYVTTYGYTAQGELATQTQFATAVATAGLSTTAPPTPVASNSPAIGYDRTTQYTYDAIGRKAKMTMVGVHYQTRNGTAGTRNVVTVYGYDAINELTSVLADATYNYAPAGATAVLGQLTQTTYDALGRVTSVTQPMRAVLASNYDSLLTGSTGNDLTSGSAASLYVQSSPYTSFNYDAFGNQVLVRRSATGWLQGSTAAPLPSGNDQTQYTLFDHLNRAVRSTTSAGTIEIRHYDANGNLTEMHYSLSDHAGNSWMIQTTTAYDGVNQQLATQTIREEPSNIAGTLVVDSQEQVTYNAFGEIVTKGDAAAVALGTEAIYNYDNAGHLVSSNAQGGVMRTYGYNLAGFQITESHQVTTAASGTTVANTTFTDTTFTTTMTYDALGRVVGQNAPAYSTNATVSITSEVLDRWGNVLQLTDPRSTASNPIVTTFEYNALNQKILEIQPLVTVLNADGSSTVGATPTLSWYYGAQGRLEGTRDTRGDTTMYGYDTADQQVQVIDPFSRSTWQAYDAFGRQVLNQDQLGYITWTAYDTLGRVIAQGDYTNDPNPANAGKRDNTTLQSYVLDHDGNRVQVTDALHHTTYNDYNGRDELVRSQSAAGEVMNYAYDDNGNKTNEEDGDTTHIGVQTWKTDYFGRLTDHHDLSNQDHSYNYDAGSGELVTETMRAAGANADSLDRTTIYYADGFVHQTKETQPVTTTKSMTTSYSYDADGNRTAEDSDTWDGQGLEVHDITTTTWDSHNRIQNTQQVDALNANKLILSVTYSYDEQGNRRRVQASSAYDTAGTGSQDAWYTYDADNRVVVANGVLDTTTTPGSPQIDLPSTFTNGYIQLYDNAGHAVGQESWGEYKPAKLPFGTIAGLALNQSLVNQRGEIIVTYAACAVGTTPTSVIQTQTWDNDGHLSQSIGYFMAGMRQIDAVQSGGVGGGGNVAKGMVIAPTISYLDVGGMLASSASYYYDADGRLTQEQQYARPTATKAVNVSGSTYNLLQWVVNVGDGADTRNQVTDMSVLQESGLTSYVGTNLGYDAAGRMIGYSYYGLDDTTQTYSTQTFTTSASQFVGRDSWLAGTISGVSTDPNDKPATTTITYDAAGRETSIEEATSVSGIDPTMRYFAYDAEGEIVRRRDGTLHNGVFTQGTDAYIIAASDHHQVYVNGQNIGSTDENGKVDAESHVTGFTNDTLGADTVVVQYGETSLAAVAQRVYGNSSLWYVLAEANGISDPNTSLTAGIALKAPEVTTTLNDATTFKPYNPADVTGPTTPSLPHINPAPQEGCGVMGTIIMAVVAAVVTFYTFGAAAEALGGLFSGLLGTSVTVLGTATTLGGAIVGGAIAGAAGSIASQAVGSAMGVTHFSWKNVASAGIAGAITMGFAGWASTSAAAPIFQAIGSAGKIAAGAVVDNLANYTANDLVGNKASFSWASVAASAVAAVASADIGKGLGLTTDNFADNLANGLIGGALGAEAQHAFAGGPKPNWGQVVGGALGGAITDGLENASAGGSFWGPSSSGDPAHPIPSASQMVASNGGDPMVLDPLTGQRRFAGDVERDLSAEADAMNRPDDGSPVSTTYALPDHPAAVTSDLIDRPGISSDLLFGNNGGGGGGGILSVAMLSSTLIGKLLPPKGSAFYALAQLVNGRDEVNQAFAANKSLDQSALVNINADFSKQAYGIISGMLPGVLSRLAADDLPYADKYDTMKNMSLNLVETYVLGNKFEWQQDSVDALQKQTNEWLVKNGYVDGVSVATTNEDATRSVVRTSLGLPPDAQIPSNMVLNSPPDNNGPVVGNARSWFERDPHEVAADGLVQIGTIVQTRPWPQTMALAYAHQQGEESDEPDDNAYDQMNSQVAAWKRAAGIRTSGIAFSTSEAGDTFELTGSGIGAVESLEAFGATADELRNDTVIDIYASKTNMNQRFIEIHTTTYNPGTNEIGDYAPPSNDSSVTNVTGWRKGP